MGKEYRIDDDLYLITGDPRGVTINYVSNAIGDGYIDAFNAGISYDNLEKLLAKLQQSDYFSWETADGGLSINGRTGKLELSFNPTRHPGRKERTLTSEEADRFTGIVQQVISQRSQGCIQ